MAISRSKMNRQLREGGGIMNVARREQFGLGSKLKKFVRKVIPNEISKVAVKAAPFVAPFNPALAGAMAGIGSFDQTGSLTDAFKSGALTYGGGQVARYVGGAGFQQNPFTQGGAFRGGLEGFKGGFTSPLGTETGLGKFFDQRKAANVGKAIKEQGEIQSLGEPLASEVSLPTTSVVDNQTQFLPTDFDTTPLNIESDLVKKVNITSDKNFLEKITSGEPEQIFDAVTDAVKKGGKAIFTKQEDGKTVLDKTALLAAGSFGLTYLDAKKIANEAGEELTVEEYDEATKADKKEEYAGYLKNFFAGKKDGGRIGFAEGSDDMKIDPENYFDPRNLNTEDLILLVRNNKGTPEIFKELMLRDVSGINSLMLDEIGGKKLDEPTEVFQVNEEELKNYRVRDRSPIESFLYDLRENNPDVYGEYKEPRQFMPIADNRANGGRIGYGTGSRPSQLFKLLEEAQAAGDEDKIKEIKSDLFREFGLKLAKGGRAKLAGGTGRKSKYKPKMRVKQIDPLLESFGGYGFKGGIGGGASPFSKAAISYLFKTLGKTGGKDRKFTMPNLYKILNNPGKFPKDEKALAAFLKIKGFKEGGRAELAMGSEVPVRKNKAGIEELDYRQSGGFVPIGIKEKADDVPAMLSKNEFVMTADAVRGIGEGSVERGAEKLYNVMKQAEKVGKA